MTSAADLALALETAQRQGRKKEAMHRTVAMPTLLIIHEIAYLPFGREQANLFLPVVARGTRRVHCSCPLTGVRRRRRAYGRHACAWVEKISP